jgi:23S rRNA (pseudouridine1915-N3)-methyltransferase
MIKKVKLVCVGKVKEKSIQKNMDKFLKRLVNFCDLQFIELKDEGMKKEAEKIVEYLNGSNVFVLDATGKQETSEEFSDNFKKLDGEIVFVIGGSDGIEQSIKDKSKMISLSKMTFTHEMARLFLIEQIYRSYMIINNRTYHK